MWGLIGFSVWDLGLGFEVWGLGVGDWGLALRVRRFGLDD